MVKPICNIKHCSGSSWCTLCPGKWDYGDYTPELCPNKGRKILDVAFEKLAPYFQELNRHKKIYINVDELLKGLKNVKRTD